MAHLRTEEKDLISCPGRQIHQVHGEVVHVDEQWRDALADFKVGPGLDWAGAVGDTLVSRSLALKCYRTVLGDGRVVYFKRYVYPRRYWLEFWMRPGKAAVEFWAYNRLRKLGIPTLDVVAFGERRVLGMLLGSFIVTPEVPNTVDLEDFVRDTWCHLPRAERQRIYKEISSGLLAQLKTAHRARFFHHDLKWSNILLQDKGGQYSTVWIDAPRASRMRMRKRRGIVTDLSALARMAISMLSPYEMMRFLCRYLGPDRKPGEAKRLFRNVAAHLSRRVPKPVHLPFPD